jgi:hypothetical protein
MSGCALCLTGAISLDDYVKRLADIGFGTIEIRAKRPIDIVTPPLPYRARDFHRASRICAIKDPMPADGPCVSHRSRCHILRR